MALLAVPPAWYPDAMSQECLDAGLFSDAQTLCGTVTAAAQQACTRARASSARRPPREAATKRSGRAFYFALRPGVCGGAATHRAHGALRGEFPAIRRRHAEQFEHNSKAASANWSKSCRDDLDLLSSGCVASWIC